MKTISIIYWSASGNTKAMAAAIGEGAKSDSTEVSVLSVEKAEIEEVLKADVLVLGCPSMGNEVLEEDEMEPFVIQLEKNADKLIDKPMALFGSFDWGDGQWMVDWENRMKKLGVNLLQEGLTLRKTPDAEGISLCKALGKKLI